jgi:hypothetical protein
VNTAEAKEALMLYRPDTADAEDPQVVDAMAIARKDPALAKWFEQHCAFQRAMRAKFRRIEPPAHLRMAILATSRIVPLQPRWRQPVWLAAAAGLALLIGGLGLWLRPQPANRFANFQARMVASALREYGMDIVTNDMRQVRQFMASRGAPADYDLTQGLERLQLTGGGILRWRSHPVSMVCFNRGDDQMLYLFVMDRSAVKDPPPETPRVSKVGDLVTASWSRGGKAYVLAGPEEADFLRKYL